MPLVHHCNWERHEKCYPCWITNELQQENSSTMVERSWRSTSRNCAQGSRTWEQEQCTSASGICYLHLALWSEGKRGVWTLKLLDESNRWTEDYNSNLFPFCFLFIFSFYLYSQCVLPYFPLITASTILYRQPNQFFCMEYHFPPKAFRQTHHRSIKAQTLIMLNNF